MRAALLTSVLTLGLLVAGQPTAAFGAAAAAKVNANDASDVSWLVEGVGATVEDAEQDALKQARENVLKYFADRKLALAWEPNLKYVDDHLVAERKSEEDINLGGGAGFAKKRQLKVVLSHREQQNVLQMDRKYRMEARQLLAGKVLLGVLLGLGVVIGYCRLEGLSRSKGTSALVRAGAAFLVGAGLVAGLLCVG